MIDERDNDVSEVVPVAGSDTSPYPTRDEVADLVADAVEHLDGSIEGAASSVGSGTVTLTQSQYEGLSSLSASLLTGQLVIGGLCAVLVGLLFTLIITTHWRVR